MDNSILSKPGKTITYKPFEFELGLPKASRGFEPAICPMCNNRIKQSDEDYYGCLCSCEHQVTSDPLSKSNPCGGGKIKR